jgi:hypothetical protein
VRRRVLQATIAAVTVAVVLLGFPLAFLGAQLIRENEMRGLEARAEALARTVDFRIDESIPLTERMLEPYVGGNGSLQANVFVLAPDGGRYQAGPDLTGACLSGSPRAAARRSPCTSPGGTCSG